MVEDLPLQPRQIDQIRPPQTRNLTDKTDSIRFQDNPLKSIRSDRIIWNWQCTNKGRFLQMDQIKQLTSRIRAQDHHQYQPGLSECHYKLIRSRTYSI